ncbi:MAG: mechanosensitive ion channel domain-containing protein [Candidatus Omnitrophota bacterium]
MERVSKRIGWEIIKKAALPSLMLFSLIYGYIFYKLKVVPTLSQAASGELTKYIGTIFILSIAILFQRIIGAVLGWYSENIASKTKTKMDDKLIPVFRKTIKVIVWIIAILAALPLYGINISALIATLGVGSLAIALAAQDTIANIIAGFLIMIDAPFMIGDKVKIPSGEIVKVLDVGIRRSKFLSDDKSVIIVPNLDLSKSKIVNYTYGA